MACSCGNSNQTPKESIEALRSDLKGLGTGLFLVAAPEKGILEYQVVMVSDLPYEECVKRGSNCFGFKWIAHSFKTKEQLEKSKRDAPCQAYKCPDNPSECPDHCVCDGMQCAG
jgi:hypothetical protein